jgi:hypothetical protein
MAADNVKSASLTNLDASPLLFSNAGQGAVGRPITVRDSCAVTATGIQTIGSVYKLVRVPTFAIVQNVVIATDAALSSATAPQIDLNWIFSDSTDDGTPTWLQGLIPTSANTGATTTIASYSSPNKMYGTVTLGTTKFAPTEEVYNGLGSNYSIANGFLNLPLFQLFGFTDGRGNSADPGGFFDLMAYVSTAAGTGVAGNIIGRVDYVI